MHIVSAKFLALIVVGLILFHAYPSLLWRRLVLFGMNVAFVSSYAGALSELIPLSGFLLLCYIYILAIRQRRSKTFLSIAIVFLLAVFLFLKQYGFVQIRTLRDWPYVSVGLSYILFRVFQMLVDTQQGVIKERLSLFRMLNYCCFFATFASGPIQRFQHYCEQEDALASLSISPETVYKAFSRITNGCIKIVAISVAFQNVHSYAAGLFNNSNTAGFLWAIYSLACMAYLMHLYINFSGYMDIVIGVGWLLGFELPENFNRPLGARNFLEFWGRWHMTLSNWFKLYLFNPIVKSLTRRWPGPRLLTYWGVLAYFITFFLMGIWHGTTSVFVIYGLFLGLGMSCNKLYEEEMRKLLGRKRFRRLRGNLAYESISQGLTISYFAVALTCLWMGMTGLKQLFGSLGILGFALSFALSLTVVIIVKIAYSICKKCMGIFPEGLARLSGMFFPRQAGLAVRVLVLIFLLFSSHSNIPEIIYMDF